MAAWNRLDPPACRRTPLDLERRSRPRVIEWRCLGAAEIGRYVLGTSTIPRSVRDSAAMRRHSRRSLAQVILADHIARHREDAALIGLARASLANRSPLAERLIDIAANSRAAVDARAHAVWLVSVEADLPQARRLATIDAADPRLRRQLDEAVATVERRFASASTAARTN